MEDPYHFMEGYSCLLNLVTLADIKFNICYDPLILQVHERVVVNLVLKYNC